MSVSYRTEFKKPMNDDFTKVLRETQDLFKQKHGVNIIGREFEDIITTQNLWEEYISSFTEDMEATEAEQVETISEAVREQILQESLAGVQSFASLTMPTLVKLWARLSLKYAVPTEPVQQPAFTVSFMKPYILTEDGVKHYIPEDINDANNGLAEKKAVKSEIALTDGKTTDDANSLLPDEIKNDLGEDIAKPGPGLWTVDKKFAITSVFYGEEEVKCNIRLDTYHRLYGEVTYGGDKKDTIFGFVDLENCRITVASMTGEATKVKVLGWFATDSHMYATNVGFDITRKDIEIGTGTHIEGSLPLELLQDTKAMYQIDGAAEIVDIMSNVCAQKLDLEIYEFLSMAYEATVGTDSDIEFTKEFDVIPPASFAINPSDWLNELKKLIDILATKMKNRWKCYNGYFVIIGNPVDTQIIPNVTWTFNNINDSQNGVDVQYSIGAMSGANKYTIISSDLMAEGELVVFFVPTTDKFKTFTYYPYTFNVVQNYLNTRTQNVPSVMLTKRHTIEEFAPIIGKIAVKNNDGSVYSLRTYAVGE